MYIPIVAEETFVDHRLSCTKQEAAAKLLGWMRGCTRVVMLRSDDGGIVEEQLPYINSLEGSLEEMLSGYRNAARNALVDALNADEPFEEHYDQVEKYDALTRRANSYLRDIGEELARGDSSSLRLDMKATAEIGEPYITIASLAAWARNNYAIDIDKIDDAPLTNFSVTSTDTDSDEKVTSSARQKTSQTAITSTNVTFGLLIELFSQTAPAFNKGASKEPNISAIGTRLAAYAEDRGITAKQSKESIKSRIEDALAALRTC